MSTTTSEHDQLKNQAIESYRKTLKRLRFALRSLEKEYDKSEEDIKALQSVGQIIVIVKASSGPRYVVGCRAAVPKDKLKNGVRVSLDMTTLTIMRILPREGGSHGLQHVNRGSWIGLIRWYWRSLRSDPTLRQGGYQPPKGVLLYGPPGTGKTLLAKAVANTLSTNFLKVVSSAIVDKYIGESARLIREMFAYAKEHEPCIIFMDEIDAIGGRRLVKDPALMRPGRLDRKIEIPLPNEVARMEILKIHAAQSKNRVKLLAEGSTELIFGTSVLRPAMFAIRDDRDYILQDDLNKAVRKIQESKKHETSKSFPNKCSFFIFFPIVGSCAAQLRTNIICIF
ncbi:26S proteasome regulatory subunit S10B [Phakopsora pachyrhizi]|uniref:26S proteasome regulatory subunit S10B n=1 Tax=Phakopsora pachyrhizi TaxID=170000 RepID=A0AAV0BUE7_PHAPC|nr:26S proteasome regulatory subunit S10B [Phakopsora pachyrhizi]